MLRDQVLSSFHVNFRSIQFDVKKMLKKWKSLIFNSCNQAALKKSTKNIFVYPRFLSVAFCFASQKIVYVILLFLRYMLAFINVNFLLDGVKMV